MGFFRPSSLTLITEVSHWELRLSVIVVCFGWSEYKSQSQLQKRDHNLFLNYPYSWMKKNPVRPCSRNLNSSTRLHSSRMRTACVLTVSPSMFWGGGGCLVPGGVWCWGVSAPWGGCLLWGVSGLGGVCSGEGVCTLEGGLLPGGLDLGCVCLLLGGVCSQGGISQHALRQTPPPVNRITHACENITLPQLRCGR